MIIPCVLCYQPFNNERSNLVNRAKVYDEEHGEHGWIHIRQSVHNPNIALNMQSSMPGGCRSMAKILRDKYDPSFLKAMFLPKNSPTSELSITVCVFNTFNDHLPGS